MLTPKKWEVIAERYRLEHELARGGMGSVWAGHDNKLKRRVAVKLVAPEWAQAEDTREAFEREAMAVARLQSPHVVQIFDYGVERGCPFIVMELLEGEDLRTRLHRLKRLTVDAAAHVLVQTAKALSVAHAAGIVHRDLKPGNIFLVRQGEEEIVKVLDFGVALQLEARDLLEDEPSDGQIMGTPQFMSPEQARGLDNLDHRTDLWALGVITYRALTGKLPFTAGEPTQVITKVCTEEPAAVSALAPDLPPGLDEFFARALSKDRDRRYASARQMTLAFSRISPVTFTTLSMPDPGPIIDQAIKQARSDAESVTNNDVDYDDQAATLAVDADLLDLSALSGESDEDIPTPPSSRRADIPAPTPPPSRRSQPARRLPPPPLSSRRGAIPPPLSSRGAMASRPSAPAPLSARPMPPPPVRASAPGSIPSAPTSNAPPPAKSSPMLLTRPSESGEFAAIPPSADATPSFPRSRPSFHPTLQGSMVDHEPSHHGEPEKGTRTVLLALAAAVVGVLLAVVGSVVFQDDAASDSLATESPAVVGAEPAAAPETQSDATPTTAEQAVDEPAQPEVAADEAASEPKAEPKKAVASRASTPTKPAAPTAKRETPPKKKPKPARTSKSKPKPKETPAPAKEPEPAPEDVFADRL